MQKSIVATLLCLALSACSSGPSSGKAETAFLAHIISNTSDDATLTTFELGECKEAEGQPGFNCVVSSQVKAMGGRFNEDMSGVYTFGESGGELRVIGVVSRTL